jgi:hypothetical protein
MRNVTLKYFSSNVSERTVTKPEIEGADPHAE